MRRLRRLWGNDYFHAIAFILGFTIALAALIFVLVGLGLATAGDTICRQAHGKSSQQFTGTLTGNKGTVIRCVEGRRSDR